MSDLVDSCREVTTMSLVIVTGIYGMLYCFRKVRWL